MDVYCSAEALLVDRLLARKIGRNGE